MKTRVQKWDNSLAIRIPKAFAAEAGLRANSAVELSLVDGTLVVAAVTSQPPTLAELLVDVSCHGD
jgi:antitoxin MazE